jgi:hypothetical protein
MVKFSANDLRRAKKSDVSVCVCVDELLRSVVNFHFLGVWSTPSENGLNRLKSEFFMALIKYSV